MLLSENVYPQEYTTLGLPDGAKARIGKGQISTIAFSPDGSQLAVASSVGIWIYDAESGKELALLPVHKDEHTTKLNYGISGNSTVNSLVFSPDSKLLASASLDGTIRLFDLTTYSKRHTLYKNEKTRPSSLIGKPAISLAFSTDGKTLTSLEKTDFNRMKVWDVTSGKLLSDVSGRIDRKLTQNDGVTFSEDTSDPSNQVNPTRGNYFKPLTLSPDGTTFAATKPSSTVVNGFLKTEIMFGDVRTGELEPPLINVMTNPPDSVPNDSVESVKPINNLIFSPDGTVFAGIESRTKRPVNHRGNRNNKRTNNIKIRFWYTSTGREISTITPKQSENIRKALCLAFSPDGNTFATANQGSTVQLWNVNTGDLISTSTIHSPEPKIPWHKTGVSALTFHPNGKTLAIATDGSENGGHYSLQLYDVGNGKFISTFTEHPRMYCLSINVVNFLCLKASNILQLRKTNTGKMYGDISSIWKNINKQIPNVEELAISSVNSFYAIGGKDGVLELWNGVIGSHLLTFEGHTGNINALTFSTDASVLASGSDDRSIRLWNTRTGEQIRILTEHAKSGKMQNFSNAPTLLSAELVNNLTFSPKNKYLAAASEYGTVWLWELSTGNLLTTITSHESAADVLLTGTGLSKVGMAFSPDNKLFASGGMNGQILLSDVNSNPTSIALNKHTWSVKALAFSPDNKLLASGSKDSTIRIWNTETGIEVSTLRGHIGEIYTLGFSLDGTTLVSGSTDGLIYLWDRNKIIDLKK